MRKWIYATALIVLLLASCASHKKTVVRTTSEKQDFRLEKVEAVTITNDSTDETTTLQMVDGGGTVIIEPQGAINVAGVKSITNNKKSQQKGRKVANMESLGHSAQIETKDTANTATDIIGQPGDPVKPLKQAKSALGNIAETIGWAVMVLAVAFLVYWLKFRKKE